MQEVGQRTKTASNQSMNMLKKARCENVINCNISHCGNSASQQAPVVLSDSKTVACIRSALMGASHSYTGITDEELQVYEVKQTNKYRV